MSIRELDASTHIWVYVVCAVAFLGVTVLMIFGIQFMRNRSQNSRRRSLRPPLPHLEDGPSQDNDTQNKDTYIDSDDEAIPSQPFDDAEISDPTNIPRGTTLVCELLHRLQIVYDGEDPSAGICLEPRNVLHVNDIALYPRQWKLHVVVPGKNYRSHLPQVMRSFSQNLKKDSRLSEKCNNCPHLRPKLYHIGKSGECVIYEGGKQRARQMGAMKTCGR